MRFSRSVCIGMSFVLLSLVTLPADAQIYNWNTGEVIPGTEGMTPGPEMYFYQWHTSGHNLQYADFSGGLDLHESRFRYSWLQHSRFSGANLADAHLFSSDLTGASFAGANLTNANMTWSNLTGVNLSGATITGASMGYSGLTQEQFYSTASYQAGNLGDIHLDGNDLAGWNLANQNMENAELYNSTLTNADLSGANLNGARLYDAYCRGASFTGATVVGAEFCGSNLTNVLFNSASLINVNLSGTSLLGADFSMASLGNMDLSYSDARGVYELSDEVLLSCITGNMIRPDSHIAGLHLGSYKELAIRDYEGGGDITVDDEFTLEVRSKLSMHFEDEDWTPIVLEPGIPVSLDGTLHLGFNGQIDVSHLLGMTFNVFDWNGCLPAGSAFADVTWPGWAQWDISDLYEGGTITLTAVPEPASLALLMLGGMAVIRRR